DTPKTAAGVRTVPLVGNLVDVLRSHRARQAQERLAAGRTWVDRDHVFTTLRGEPLGASAIWTWWNAVTARADIGHHRFHATRHTAATMLLDEGVPLEVVSAILGHANLSITADVYAKVTQDAKRRALSTLDARIGVV
ncbi:MAG TPA: tyrosine-type recombinase/integrase, partial [Jatrophihabitantaceae bacterium]|nr:tyrosine-type recombinase/integrase [Jatrophihabitantaceae bacterium]